MDDLITFLRAQLDEDERVARAAGGEAWRAVPVVYGPADEGWGEPDQYEVHTTGPEGWSTIVSHQTYEGGGTDRVGAEHIARHGPARVLAEVEAKRRILDLCDKRVPGVATRWLDVASFNQVAVVRLLALPYDDRPGYRQEWRLDG